MAANLKKRRNAGPAMRGKNTGVFLLWMTGPPVRAARCGSRGTLKTAY